MLNFVRVVPLPSSACKLIHLQSPTSNTNTNLQTYLRAGEAPSTGLTEALVALGFETDRLKTGTPSRVDTRTIDYSQLEQQPGDADVRWFSFDPEVRGSCLPGPPRIATAYSEGRSRRAATRLATLPAKAVATGQLLRAGQGRHRPSRRNEPAFELARQTHTQRLLSRTELMQDEWKQDRTSCDRCTWSGRRCAAT